MKSTSTPSKGFQLDISAGYFQNCGINIMAFDDIYPAGHQSGISIIMHGHRVATNGDIFLWLETLKRYPNLFTVKCKACNLTCKKF